ncbi:hypothetical protein LCGC14_1101360, partial [marine sediment metagenome]
LPCAGACYFAAKATNSVGVSSVFSNEAEKLMGPELVPPDSESIAVSWQESPSAQDLIISNTLPGNYEWSILAVGELVYIDRSYIFTSVPSELVGLNYLRTANNDKGSTGGVSFDVNKQVTVFVAYDVRFSTDSPPTIPAWLTLWTKIGMTVSSNDASFNIYSKDFPAGNISLGGNDDSGAYLHSMYSVMVSKL